MAISLKIGINIFPIQTNIQIIKSFHCLSAHSQIIPIYKYPTHALKVFIKLRSNMNMHQIKSKPTHTSPHEHAHPLQSSHIVAKIIQDTILHNAARNYVPREYVYHDSISKATLIQDSITGIAHVEPDCAHAKILQNQDILRSPTIFKVKQQSIKHSLQNLHKKSSIKSRVSRQSIKSIDQKMPRVQSQADAQMQIGHSNSIHLVKKMSSKELSRTNCRFFPSVSAHCEGGYREKSNQNSRSSKENQHRDYEDDIIKVMRENKLILNAQSKNKNNNQKQAAMKKQDLLKKFKDTLKQTQVKKFMALTTNYDGFLIAIGKSEANRQVSHYIDVQAQLVEQNQKSNHVQGSQAREAELNHEFTNYKELKYCERESKFANSLYRNFLNRNKEDVYLNPDEKNKSQSNITQKQFKRPAQVFRLSGKTYKPTKVGFNTFQKMKKSNWKIQKLRDDSKDQSSYTLQNKNGVELKIPTKKKIEAKQSKSQSLRQSKIFNENNKKQSITLGNTQAVNFLLYGGDRKYLKKTVKINSQFL